MQKSIINNVHFYLYSSFVRETYEKISEIEDKEEVYLYKDKLVVIVKDEEIGQRIYDILKNLKDNSELKISHSLGFEVKSYITDGSNRVKLFCLKLHLCKLLYFKHKLFDSSKIILSNIVSFIYEIYNLGYIIDASRFENEKCSSISDFFSFFVPISENVDTTASKGCIIKYIHYVLSNGGNFDEFYEKIVKSNEIHSLSDFPYTLPIIKMCYAYYTRGDVPESFENFVPIVFIAENKSSQDDSNCLIADKTIFESNFSVTEICDDYTIYNGNIKIYHNMSEEFRDFLIKNSSTINMSNACLERIGIKIIDFNLNVIGYKFYKSERQYAQLICDKRYKNQSEILDTISKITTYLSTLKNSFDGKKELRHFSISKFLLYIEDTDSFIISSPEKLYDLLNSDWEALENQIVKMFFKIFLKYLNEKYGKLNSREEFLKNRTVRYLSPVIAREFINYALGIKTDFQVAKKELFKFIDSHKEGDIGDTILDGPIWYDQRFEFNSIFDTFLFDYEAEKKYGLEIKPGMCVTFSNGSRLITFDNYIDISELKRKKDSVYDKIRINFGYIQDEHVKLVGISQIIYSKDINTDNMYYVVGYITEPIRGQKLTEETLLNLNNKDLLFVTGYLFSKFAECYITFDTIYMDTNFVFYIDFLSEQFKIVECQNTTYYSIVYRIFQYLKLKGYNPNATFICNLSQYQSSLTGRNDFLAEAQSLDTYCDEHSIYYNGVFGCPICSRTKYFVNKRLTKSHMVFEDLYARHYRIDEEYILKVYKHSVKENWTELEKIIDWIIDSDLYSAKIDLGQDCFRPYKKALNHEKSFIGYIYKATQFNGENAIIDLFNNIENTQNLKNLPRLKSLIRLILQVKEITKRNLGFIKDPFSYVFLSKEHKKQVQILNIDFLSEKGSVEETLKWTCEYVAKVLASDVSIGLDISDCAIDLDAILEKLQLASNDMTKYCSIHKRYYKNSFLFCPVCMEKSEMDSLPIEEIDESEITQKMQVNEGGESIIYHYTHDSVAKVFKGEVNYDLKSLVITRILRRREILEEINRQHFKYKFILPQTLLIDKTKNKIFGYIMKKVDGKALSTLRDTSEVSKLGITTKDIFEILIAVGEGIQNLHANNIYIGDLNGRNILFDTDKNVYFLDFDGMGVDEISPEFCTDGYIDPISKKNQNITMKDDWYSFAIQAFYYLTFTHPFNGIYSVKEDGKSRTLDIPEKMERRISLLGNHGMKAPSIAKPWDWMSGKLINAFLNIFEGNSRESIVPHLIEQYKETFFSDIIRINPKFIAKRINPFNEMPSYIINHYSAVCCKDNEFFVRILLNDEKTKDIHSIELIHNLENILLSDDNEIAFFIYKNKVIAIDLTTENQVICGEIINPKNVVVNGRTLYFTGISEEGNIINKIDFMPDGEVKKEKIKFLTEKRTKRFYVKFNSKFLIVKFSTTGPSITDEIYCNSELLCEVCSSSEYNIIYDDATKSWLVINSGGFGIVINGSNGTFKKVALNEYINSINLDNIGFIKGRIYIPSQDYLHIVNIDDQVPTKHLECKKIISPNSKLYNINNDGFSVITDSVLYEIRRG